MPEADNLAFVRAVFEQGWNRGSFGFLANRAAPIVTMHYNGQASATSATDLPGLVAFWRGAFPDLHFEIRHLVAVGDLVAVSLVFRGTHRGPWQGVAPSGAAVEVEEMMFFRFENGVLAEMWELFDEQTLWRQIGEAAGR